MPDKIKIQEQSKKEWEKYLNLFHYSLFITPEWIEAIADSTHTPIYLNFFLKDIKVGKISGLIIKRSETKTYLYFYAGPALKELNEDIYTQCLNALYRFAKKHSYAMISIGSFDSKHSLRYRGYKYMNTKRYEFVVPLSKGLQEININKRFKRNVKKARKVDSLIKHSGDIKEISILLKLLKETKKIRIQKYSTEYQPFYLANLNENALKKLIRSGIARIHYTENNDSIDSMEFNLEKDKYVYMLLKGTNENGYKNGLSSVLSYSLINEYIGQGYFTYNQGGRPPGSDGAGLEVFKKSMGAEKIATYSAISNFLTYPYKLLNPLILLLRLLPKSLLNNIKKRFW